RPPRSTLFPYTTLSRSAIDDDRAIARAHLEGEEAGMRARADRERRRRADVADELGRAAVESHIARIGRRADRRAFDIVIAEHRGDRVGRRRPSAIEAGERAVAGAEEAQHRHD